MNFGRRIYFELETGNIILDTGERSGGVLVTTREQDFSFYNVLNNRVEETVDMIQLEYGEYSQDFALGFLRGVDLTTRSLLFSYPNPQEPGEEPPAQQSLSGQVVELKADIIRLEEMNKSSNDNFLSLVDVLIEMEVI